MSVPNHRSIVEAIYAKGGHNLETKEGAGKFTEACCLELHAKDPGYGHLEKPPNRTHVVGPDGRRHAVDVVLYRDGDVYWTVDIIVNAGEPGAHTGWGVEESDYTSDDWYSPTGTEPDEPDEPDEPCEPETPAIPYNESYAIEFGLACNDVYRESGAAFDPGMVSVHSQRAAWDFYVGGMLWPDSKHKHINEFRAVYGLPPIT